MSDEISSQQREGLMQSLRERLETERQELLLRLANQTVGNMPEGACYGDRGAEDATDVYEQTAALTLSTHFQGRLKAIEEALARLVAGTYGVCENCHRPIEEARLAVLPDTTRCYACAQTQTSQRRR